MIVYFIAVALLAICKPCMSLDALKQQGLTASNVNDGTEMTFDLHKGNGTGSAYYDVTVRAMYGRPKSLSVKLCKIEGAHFDFEMATMNTLRDALGVNEEEFVSYGFPHIVSVGYLDKHPIIIYPRFGMSLAEKLKISVQISQRDAHNREMLTIVYTVVKIAELCNSKGVVVGKFSTKDIIITPHIHIRDLIRAQRYKPPINWYSYWGHTPSKGSANFLETDARYTRATDVYQLADMMDSVFPHKIPECRTNDKVFPEDFTVRARAIYGDNDPRYWDLLGTITRCMTTIGMSIPNYPALPPESLIAL